MNWENKCGTPLTEEQIRLLEIAVAFATKMSEGCDNMLEQLSSISSELTELKKRKS